MTYHQQQLKMGQILTNDSNPSKKYNIQQTNVIPYQRQEQLIICPKIKIPYRVRVLYNQTQKQIEVVYKFGLKHIIHFQLTKAKPKKQKGMFINISNDYVYGFKHRKLERTDKIKPQRIFFKKRMYAYEVKKQKSKLNKKNQSQTKSITAINITNDKVKQRLLLKFSQVKFLSLLGLGSKLGRVDDGSDGYITQNYIQYFSELTIDKLQKSVLKKSDYQTLCKKIQKQQISTSQQIEKQLSYSKFLKSYVLKQKKYWDKNIVPEIQQNEYENRSINYLISKFQAQVNSAIMKLNNQTKMLSAINNLIIQHDISKAIEKFQQNIQSLSQDQREEYASEVSSMVSKHQHYRPYQRQIQSIINKSSIISSGTDGVSSNQDLLKNKKNKIQSSNKQHNQILTAKQAKINNQFSDKIEQVKTQNQNAFVQFCQKLKISILDNNKVKIKQILVQISSLNVKSNLQIQILYAKLLMENGHSRHALIVFQKIMYFLSDATRIQLLYFYQSALLMGLIYCHRFSYKKALTAFQKALSILIKLSHYSIKMLALYNNLSCVYHLLKNYDKSILYLHRGFKLGQYSADYQFLMRSNMAMTLAQKGMIKQAKNQILKTNRIIEPVSNMVIFCKFYSNWAYLDLFDQTADKSLQKAKNNFDQACSIQQKFLIPNGYRPSIFLHNNIAMLHYRKKQWRKAAGHFQKIFNQLNDLDGIVAVKTHFNIAKIYKEFYNYDISVKHFHQAKILLNKFDQLSEPKLKIYKQKIQNQIKVIETLRIDQVSEEQSYSKFSYMSSSLVKNRI